MEWSLKELYDGFDSPEYKADAENLKKEIDRIVAWSRENLTDFNDAGPKLETYISARNSFAKYLNLYQYSFLIAQTYAENQNAIKNMELCEELFAELVPSEFLFKKYLLALGDSLADLIENSDVLKAHKFFLEEQREAGKHLLTEEQEITVAKFKITGSSSWEKLRDYLKSMLTIKIESDKEIPFAEARALAYSGDPETRKKAYFAELEAYKKIDAALSFSLNSIKGEAITESEMRKYDSLLDSTLFNMRMDRESLDAMLGALKNNLPAFRKYLKHKARLLNRPEGLPFYDLFAPIGSSDKSYSFQEAVEFVETNLSKVNPKAGEFVKKAAEKPGRDVYPREGKVGGAFDDGIYSIGESRILLNFTGVFDDITTLAHELGHAYHDSLVQKETYINSFYTSPIAETASVMQETITAKAAAKNAPPEEAAAIMESYIQGMTQVIVDIYSRFLFEDELIKRRKGGALSSEELSEIMLDAQKEAYGDALSVYHPYMWAAKSHYYDASANYYNFPYAYGLLFAKGLYALYLERGESFLELYDSILQNSGKYNLRDLAALAGIETRDPAFWEKSFSIIKSEIDEFINFSNMSI
jgi:pepF/M3 family oligoendopeptidase